MELNDTPLISFIVPIFNTDKYLSECVDSIISHQISKEIILIDDGSKDNSLNIAIEYSRKYNFITVISSQNKGQSVARNKGIKLSKGKYIYFIDSDDILLNTPFTEICDLADNYDLDFVKLQAQKSINFDGYKKDIIRISSGYPNILPNAGVILSGYDLLNATVNSYWIPALCWTLIRRQFLEDNNILFYENAKAEDQLFYIQLLTCKPNIKLIEVGNISYHYRLRPNSTMTSLSTQFFVDHFIICDLIQQWIEQNQFTKEVTENLYKIKAYIYKTAIVIFSKLEKLDQEKYRSYITKDIINFIQEKLGS